MKEETKCYCGHTTYCDCAPEIIKTTKYTLELQESYNEKEVFKILNDFCFDWNYNYKGELSQKEYLIEWFNKNKKI